MNILNQFWKIFLALTFFMFGCKNDSIKEKSIIPSTNEAKDKKKIDISNNRIIKTLNNNKFKLNIETIISNDTLDIIDYKEDYCSTPIVLDQNLFFYENDKLLIKFKLPIKYIKRKTITKANLNILQISIYEMCLSKTKNRDYYIISGSGCCDGSDCPEFIGIYTMKGVVIYEGVSNEKNKLSLKDILIKNNINLNKSTNCVNTEVLNKT